jgi:hypothetical protein
MRLLIALIIIVYFIGVGVVLAPTVETNWRSAPAARFAASVGQELPYALAWPARVYWGVTSRS